MRIEMSDLEQPLHECLSSLPLEGQPKVHDFIHVFTSQRGANGQPEQYLYVEPVVTLGTTSRKDHDILRLNRWEFTPPQGKWIMDLGQVNAHLQLLVIKSLQNMLKRTHSTCELNFSTSQLQYNNTSFDFVVEEYFGRSLDKGDEIILELDAGVINLIVSDGKFCREKAFANLGPEYVKAFSSLSGYRWLELYYQATSSSTSCDYCSGKGKYMPFYGPEQICHRCGGRGSV